MNKIEIKLCPGTLSEGFNTYSPTCIKFVFNNHKVNHILDFESSQKSEKVAEIFIDNRKRISISGVQEKLSFLIDKNRLRPTQKGEQGTYILKPIPRDLKKVAEVPANEHLTMQIAKQVFKIKTAENALTFFKDGQPAYLTKRFDIKQNGGKWGIEDFATLAGKTIDNEGANFKYKYNYEKAAEIIRNNVSAWKIEIEKYFTLILFNYLFSNGDAHLKNFSLLESKSGDYLLSPAYDLLNTKIHVDDTDFALNQGLFDDNYKSKDYIKNNHPSKIDFFEFGKRIGIKETRIDKLIEPFLMKQELIESLVHRSFLSKGTKNGYLIRYNTKRNYLTSK